MLVLIVLFLLLLLLLLSGGGKLLGPGEVRDAKGQAGVGPDGPSGSPTLRVAACITSTWKSFISQAMHIYTPHTCTHTQQVHSRAHILLFGRNLRDQTGCPRRFGPSRRKDGAFPRWSLIQRWSPRNNWEVSRCSIPSPRLGSSSSRGLPIAQGPQPLALVHANSGSW